MTAVSDQMTPPGPAVCVCGHVLEVHEQGHGTQRCDALIQRSTYGPRGCDCSEFQEVEGP